MADVKAFKPKVDNYVTVCPAAGVVHQLKAGAVGVYLAKFLPKRHHSLE